MSEVSNRVLMQALEQPPEMDDPEEMDDIEDEALFESSMVDIEESIGDLSFKYTYINLIYDILSRPFDERRIFCQRILDKIQDVYDFTFSTTLDIATDAEIDRVLKFVQFVEYDNVLFISLVWEMLKKDPTEINIETFCKSNADKIIKETEEQLQTHHKNELIENFLRTYYKEKFIEWFIRESERHKTFIKLEILEREGKLNV